MSQPVIIVLGGGLDHKNALDPARMWAGHQTRLRAEAAAVLWRESQSSLIVCSGGKTSAHSPSEAEAMKDFVMNEPWNIPEALILTENDSVETAENVRNTVRLLQSHKIATDAVTLIAGRRHLHRAARYFMAYGISTKARSSCSVLCLKPESICLKDRIHEAVLTLLQLLDRKGYVPTWIKRHHIKI